MITTEELHELLLSTESYRVERTASTTNTDKFCEAICAFANDMPNSSKAGYLIIGATDDGHLRGLRATDELLKNLAAIRSDGNILPMPVMSVEKHTLPEGDLVVIEVQPSKFPPVRYRGRTHIRIGPRKDIATTAEERILGERCSTSFCTFDITPCFGSSLNDIDTTIFTNDYLPKAIAEDVLKTESRDVKEQLASLRLFDLRNDCLTYAAIILFGKNPEYFLSGDYIQYVRFDGNNNAADIKNEYKFSGCLLKILPKLDTFIETSLIQKRPIPISALKENTSYNFPQWAIRELLMNAVMHRDYQTNTPTKFYQYNDRIEIVNAGGLYGNARPENFPNVNDYRNPIIAEALKILGYVNKFNRGIARVQDDLRKNGNKKAEFDVSKITVFGVMVKDATDAIDINIVNKETNQVFNKALKLHKAQILYNTYVSGDDKALMILFVNSVYPSLNNEMTFRTLSLLEDSIPKGSKEIFESLGVNVQTYSYKRIIDPLVDLLFISKTEQEKKSPRQKYVISDLGLAYLKFLKESRLAF